MTDQEIEASILGRLYYEAFAVGAGHGINIHEYGKEIGTENDRVWRVFHQLDDRNLVESYAIGGAVRITPYGIQYCENNHIVEDDLIQDQLNVRISLLDAAARLYEQHGQNRLFTYADIINEAGVEEHDFRNNYQFLTCFGLLENKTGRCYQITVDGMDVVKDHRQRYSRLESFKKLASLDGITPQQRGHQIEDLLTEVATSEAWDAKPRVRSQGQEHDIIMHVGLHYFLVSCKWEKNPIEPHEVELLESRVRSRATTNGGLLFSMSGFTENCIEEARLKISSAQILLFGPQDIQDIFCCESTLTNLLDSKLEHAMHHRKILVDGQII